MNYIKSNSLFIKQTLLLCWILFSFLPCTIKEYFGNAVEISYQKPLNKSKSTTSSLSCQYADTISSSKLAVQKKDVDERLFPSNFIEFNPVTLATKIKAIKYYQNYSGNSPPKYILYKRMKISLA